MITDSRFDGGKAFDWGRTSDDYAKYRDIYPESFYETIHSLGLCTQGQRVLDIGTGTGVIPRNMYRYGAGFTGADISENQIKQAKALTAEKGMKIDFIVSSAEELNFPDGSFDVITACQCHFYFKPDIFAPKAYKLLKDGGKTVFMYMGWLPYEDKTAAESEKLIIKYNPSWSGRGDTRKDIYIAPEYYEYFTKGKAIIFDTDIPFTRESWNGRIKACRGIGASLSGEEISAFEKEHLSMLERTVPERFSIRHYCALTVLDKK